MALDKQINLFKIDTNAFLTDAEEKEHAYLVKLKKERDEIYKQCSGRMQTLEKSIKHYKGMKHLGEPEQLLLEKADEIKKEEKRWKDFILKSAADAVEYNLGKDDAGKHVRELNDKYIHYKDRETGEPRIMVGNVISMFESTLSRSFEIQTNELTYDIFILEIYYYDIAKDLILNGFNYAGNHYVYFSSSAGQIRTKKAVFVNEQKLNKCRNKLMCGLTPEIINEKGGMNINKYLAYVALANSATDLWEDVFGREFDIDKSIVVDDFETLIDTKVDEIDYVTYKITENKEMQIPIPHTDGCGMILPEYSSKNFMVRLPYMKGLLGSFDFKKFIAENKCSGKVKDLWGKEYDIIDDDIQVIFTKSQLKMYKFYSSWDEYKDNFKKYGCEACICNYEEDKISNAHINYQMLQTLYLANDEDIIKMSESSNNNINTVCDSLENALRFYGVYKNDFNETNKDWFQKSLKIYPELINDKAARKDLKDLRDSYVKRYRGGHLDVIGKFTFVLPDLYAFCEWLFQGAEIPQGKLANNEVYCRLYKNTDELDCLRSPHLYIEHAVRNNVCKTKPELSEWFNTDAIYTSTFDPISRILQFDVDGDRLLVIAQRDLVQLAKRCSEGVNPLYYEMHKANAEQITPQNLYKGLKLAFTGGRIGGISNDITKIWNTDSEITNESKSAIKWLCMETNFTIDYAKTLFKPTRPKEVDDIIKKYTRNKTPYFFKYAKNKNYSDNYEDSQVEKKNNRLVNRLDDIIISKKLMFNPIRKLGFVNYLYLLKDMTEDVSDYNDQIVKYFDSQNRKYGNNLKIDDSNTDVNNINIIGQQILDGLHEIEPDDNKIITALVANFYKIQSTKKKKLLWYIYGEQIYTNLINNLNLENFCWKCGKRDDSELIDGICLKCAKGLIKNGKKLIYCQNEWCQKPILINKNNTKTCRCSECQKEHHRKIDAEYRRNKRLVESQKTVLS